MSTNIDTIWVFALFSKCNNLSTFNLIFSFFIVALVWLTMAIIHWSHPGGPAWGKYRLTHMFHWAKKPIPGPRGWPVIGSMGLMMGLAHRKISAMAQTCKANRLIAFSLGETRVIVTCHHEVARDILHSSNFADRPIKESAYSLMFNRAIGFAPYGVYWRTLRRVASTHMFSPKQIKASEAQRYAIAEAMAAHFGNNHGPFQPRDVLRRASLSNMMGSVFGRKCGLVESPDNMESEELREMVGEGYDLLGMLNWGDHLSWLSDFDFQKTRFRCSKLVPRVNRFVGRIIAEHRDNPVHSSPDFVDVLLSLSASDKLSDSDMIAVLWEMIFRGTDTVAVLIEWILARVVLHPDIQSRVHDELDNIVGRSRAVSESDITSLVYLTAVIKEVLRLHPPGPLLSWARLAIEDTTVDGHHVPAGTTAMVDMWAIARDPNIWPEPETFNPDRFLGSGPENDFSVLGSDLRLAPFGSGRRACPGKALGLATVSYWVASLLHEYEWVPSDGNATVDLSEVLKLSCEMAHPLTVEVRHRRASDI
ncbi:Cytochrome P450 78A3 [Bienertia sinuspersici]